MEKLLSKLGDAPSRRTTDQDNMVFPGTMLEKTSFTQGPDNQFAVGVLQNGNTAQYYCLLIYKGNAPEGEPVYTGYRAFTSEIGMFTRYFHVDTSRFEEGRYTAVTCVATREGNSLLPVSGSASMTDIYCIKEYQRPWHLILRDADTKETVDSLFFSNGEGRILELWRSPVPSYGSGLLEISENEGLVEIHEAGGLMSMTPMRYGTGELRIVYDNKMILTIPINICSHAGGHQYKLIAVPSEPTMEYAGVSVHLCDHCSAVYRENVPGPGAAFSKMQDIPTNAWYRDTVQEAVFRGLFNGVSATAFGPTQSMTRAMLVTVLWRYEGSPSGDSSPFFDVEPNAWYANAVSWAANQGIVDGVGHGLFKPNGKITREQMATVLYRYALKKGYDTEIFGSVEEFVDGAQVQTWAREPLAWAVGHSIVSGVNEKGTVYLRPQGDATRSQVSAILIRFIHGISEPDRAIELPDMTDAVDGGQGLDTYWAFYEDGRLVIGGEGTVYGTWGIDKAPWDRYREQIKEVEILYGIQELGDSLFTQYPSLEKVTLAESVDTIGNYAFYECTNLSVLNLAQGLEYIGYAAFQNCTSLAELKLPYGVREIGWLAFAYCTSLKELELPDSITLYRSHDGRNNRGGLLEYAFEGCSSIETVQLPIALTELQMFTFSRCTSLKEVSLPPCLKLMNMLVFSRCTALESIVIPDSVSEIFYGIFSSCTALKEVYVLSPYYKLNEANVGAFLKESDKWPFGDRDQVVVYGYVGSATQALAQRFGYRFVDILTVIE
ncbi:MAG: leucine-rich repeat protein [Oscillospiraceae bacterium]|nr:leucine-rich repeat protein [Oscillospiraceae bacterium]